MEDPSQFALNDNGMGLMSPDTSVKLTKDGGGGGFSASFFGSDTIHVFSDVTLTVDSGGASNYGSNHVKIPPLTGAKVSIAIEGNLTISSSGGINAISDDDLLLSVPDGGITTENTIPPWANVKHFKRQMGLKKYELTNHLGNIHGVVSDRKIGVDDGVYNSAGTQTSGTPDDTLDYYIADVVSYSDYYPFGSLMPGRHASADEYRYGYQGSEKDDEVRDNTGASYTTFYRMLDTRLGRWLSVDPKTSPGPTPP